MAQAMMPISNTKILLQQIEITGETWKTICDTHQDFLKEPTRPRILAASSATAAELEAAKNRAADGTKPVVPDKRPYRPKVKNAYTDPEYVPRTG